MDGDATRNGLQALMKLYISGGIVFAGLFYVIERVHADGSFSVHARDGDHVKTVEYAKGEYQPVSRYEFIDDDRIRVVAGARNIEMDRAGVRDRQTGEELGLCGREPRPSGWVDKHTIALLGQVMWTCPENVGPQAIYLMEQVLLPMRLQ